MSEDRPYATVSTPDLLLLHMALAEHEDLVIGACGILKRIMKEISLRDDVDESVATLSEQSKKAEEGESSIRRFLRAFSR